MCYILLKYFYFIFASIFGLLKGNSYRMNSLRSHNLLKAEYFSLNNPKEVLNHWRSFFQPSLITNLGSLPNPTIDSASKRNKMKANSKKQLQSINSSIAAVQFHILTRDLSISKELRGPSTQSFMSGDLKPVRQNHSPTLKFKRYMTIRAQIFYFVICFSAASYLYLKQKEFFKCPLTCLLRIFSSASA